MKLAKLVIKIAAPVFLLHTILPIVLRILYCISLHTILLYSICMLNISNGQYNYCVDYFSISSY